MIKQIAYENMNRYFELSQLYEEEFVPLTGAVCDDKGHYPVSTQIDETHIGYFYCECNLEIGFIIIDTEKEPYDVCEFFVLKEHRKRGIGKRLAFEIFDLHRVDWSVKQLLNANQAISFWRRIIGIYTRNNFTEKLFDDEKWGKVYIQLFSSKE